eukprot:CAMPEP_0204459990 /NCGR_PEP_ID=MMETSP0471-20130131/4515_1 /ASSEMBLY_ACC=CAM_ASM_000602 /TAXON_ID=2969 /ORGANISM="Oxyrrhis marina" /LENGTH=131 /DNA_ID=CAMNT_0051460833 /DNA_START=22 /DNA_END=414 /DNA_ORIENTATION=-
MTFKMRSLKLHNRDDKGQILQGKFRGHTRPPPTRPPSYRGGGKGIGGRAQPTLGGARIHGLGGNDDPQRHTVRTRGRAHKHRQAENLTKEQTQSQTSIDTRTLNWTLENTGLELGFGKSRGTPKVPGGGIP